LHGNDSLWILLFALSGLSALSVAKRKYEVVFLGVPSCLGPVAPSWMSILFLVCGSWFRAHRHAPLQRQKNANKFAPTRRLEPVSSVYIFAICGFDFLFLCVEKRDSSSTCGGVRRTVSVFPLSPFALLPFSPGAGGSPPIDISRDIVIEFTLTRGVLGH